MGFEVFKKDKDNKTGFAVFSQTPRNKSLATGMAGTTITKAPPLTAPADFRRLDQASLKLPVPKYEKKTMSFDEFASQGNPGWEAAAVPGYGAYRLGQLLPESVRKWGTRAGETGGEIMTLSHLPKKTSTESKAGDVTADLFGNVMGFVTNPRGGVQSLGAGLWRGTEGAVGALLPKIAPKITQASPVVQTGIRSGLTSVPWEATYAGVNDRPMSAGEMGLAVGANVGLDMLTHGLARGVGRKAPAPAERSASYDYLVDMEPASTAKSAPDFTVDPLGNAVKGRPLQALPSGTKPLALPPGRQPLALPGGEPKMLNAGQNWEFGTGYPKEGYWFADPFGVVRGTPETALALPEGLPTSPEVRFGDPRGQVHYPSSEFTRNAQHVKALEGKYKKIVNDEIASMKDEIGGVIRYRPGEGAPLLRASMNPKWYRDFYAANGRAPRAGEMRDMAIERLIRGNPETGEPPSEEFLGILSELSRGRKMPEEWHGLTRSMREMEATGEPELRPLIGEMSRRRAGLEPSGLNRNLGKLTDMENSIRRRTRMADEADFGQYGEVRFKRTQDQDLAILREVMTKRVGPLRIGKVDLAPEAFTKPDFKAAQTIADKLGLRLVAFKGTGHRGMQQGRTIYLNQNMKDPLDYVFWHEVGHTMEVTHPQHYDSLMGIALEHMQDADGLLKHYKDFGYAMEDMPHEFAADVFAEALHTPGFFARVAEKSPEILKPLLEAIDSLIANIKAMVSKDDTVLPYLKDLEKLRERIHKEVAEPYFRDAMGEKEFVDTFGKQWQDSAAKAKGEKVETSNLHRPFSDDMIHERESDLINRYSVEIDNHAKNSREEMSVNEARKLIQDSLWQLEQDSRGTFQAAGGKLSQGGLWDSVNARGLKQALPEGKSRRRLDDGTRIIGNGIVRDFVQNGRMDLRGQVVKNAEDMATLAQVYRNPKFETFRIIYTKGDKIVGHEGMTSRLPGQASLLGPNETHARLIYDIKNRINRMGADGYYLLHNHPSGHSKPSQQDVNVTGFFYNEVPGCKGHIVINSNEYSIIEPSAVGWTMDVKTLSKQFGEDLLLKPSQPHGLLGKQIHSPGDVVDIAENLKDQSDKAIVIYRASNGEVRAIQEVPIGIFNTVKGATDYIRGRARDFGSREAFVVTYDPKNNKNIDKMVGDGVLLDAIFYDKNVSQPMQPGNNLGGQSANDKWMGINAHKVKYRVNEDSPNIRYKLDQKNPLDDVKAMVEYGAANLRGGRASFEKAIRQQFGNILEGYSPEVANRLLNDIWHDARDLQQKGETVLKFQGQEIPLKRGEVAQPTAKAATTGEGGLLEGLDINPSELRDISGRQAGWRDIWRNMRDTFGDKFPEIEKRILYPLEDAKAAWVDHQRTLTDDLYTNVVDGLGIKKGSRESELVQLYGEGGYRHWESAPKSEQSRQRWLANLERKYGRQNVEFTGDGAYVNESFDYNDLVNEVGAERAADIVQAENWFRQKYDELLDQVNTVREQLYPGQQDKLVPKRQDYFHHFREMEGVEGVMNLFDTSAQISPELAGKSMYTRPKTKFAGFMQQRGLGKYKPDAVGGFLEYVPSATYAIHIDPQGAAFRQLENELVKTMDGNTGINKFLEYLKYYADDIQGKTNFFDRNWQFLTSRELFQGLVALNNRIKGNMVLGNAGTMVSQVFNMPQGIAFAKQYSAPGLTRYLSSLIKRMADPEGFAATNPMAESRFLKERFSGDMYRRFATKPGEKAKNVAVIGMEDVDRFATEFIWSAAYEKALHTKGITDPVRYADYHARRLVAGRGVGEVPLMQKSKIVQLVAPFQVEVGNLLNVIGDMRVDKDWIGAFVALPLTLWLFNRGSEAVKGTPVALDPIEAVQEAIQIARDDTKDDKALRIFGRLAGEFLGNMPLGQTVAALYPEYGFKAGDKQLPTRKEFFGREDPTRYGSGLLIARAIQDPLYKAVFPWGGAQAKKTVQGIDALRKGGSYTNKDQLRYPISTDPVNALKGVVFGPSGFRETDPYYEADRRPLSEKQTEKVQKSRSPKEAYEGIHRTRKINALKQQIKDIAEDKKLSPEEKKKKTAILKLELQKVKAGY